MDDEEHEVQDEVVDKLWKAQDRIKDLEKRVKGQQQSINKWKKIANDAALERDRWKRCYYEQRQVMIDSDRKQ